MSMIEDAQILSETTNDSAQSGGLPDWLVSLADMLSGGRKGKFVTDALESFDLVKDPQQFKTIYNQNPGIINDYFNQIDLVKVNKAFGGQAKPAMKLVIKDIAVNNIPGILIGTAAGIILGRLLVRQNPTEIWDDVVEAWND